MDEQSKPEEPKTKPVGYGNPPKHTRFQKGQSGNPEGRPKGTLNLATVLERTLREKVVINENGKRKTITKLEAAVKQLTNKAASGELRALQLLTALVRSAEERAIQAGVPNSALDEVDEKVVLGILNRLGAANKGIKKMKLTPNDYRVLLARRKVRSRLRPPPTVLFCGFLPAQRSAEGALLPVRLSPATPRYSLPSLTEITTRWQENCRQSHQWTTYAAAGGR
jgi:hypothetical protein